MHIYGMFNTRYSRHYSDIYMCKAFLFKIVRAGKAFTLYRQCIITELDLNAVAPSCGGTGKSACQRLLLFFSVTAAVFSRHNPARQRCQLIFQITTASPLASNFTLASGVRNATMHYNVRVVMVTRPESHSCLRILNFLSSPHLSSCLQLLQNHLSAHLKLRASVYIFFVSVFLLVNSSIGPELPLAEWHITVLDPLLRHCDRSFQLFHLQFHLSTDQHSTLRNIEIYRNVTNNRKICHHFQK